MTREDAIDYVQAAFDAYESEFGIGDDWSKEHEARDMAIQALSQEPCTDAVSREDAIEAVKQAIYNHDSAIMRLTELPSVNPQPCDDTISREDALEALNTINGTAELDKAFEVIENLPSVTQKSGKWIRWREEIQRGTHYTENVPHCKCSECDTEYDTYASRFINYCPNCGAKMVETQESEE